MKLSGHLSFLYLHIFSFCIWSSFLLIFCFIFLTSCNLYPFMTGTEIRCPSGCHRTRFAAVQRLSFSIGSTPSPNFRRPTRPRRPRGRRAGLSWGRLSACCGGESRGSGAGRGGGGHWRGGGRPCGAVGQNRLHQLSAPGYVSFHHHLALPSPAARPRLWRDVLHPYCKRNTATSERAEHGGKRLPPITPHGVLRPVLIAPVSAIPALLATVRRRPGPFCAIKTASSAAGSGFHMTEWAGTRSDGRKQGRNSADGCGEEWASGCCGRLSLVPCAMADSHSAGSRVCAINGSVKLLLTGFCEALIKRLGIRRISFVG